jgi:beta-glucosidase
VAWDKVQLAPGESKTVSLGINPQYLSTYNVDTKAWELAPGEYRVHVGGSSRNIALNQTVQIEGRR